MKQDKEQLGERENDVEGRETAVKARESEVEMKDQEADEKLLEAKNERNMTEKILEQINQMKNEMTERWNEILEKIRNGALTPSKVEKVAEMNKELSTDDLEDLSNDILELVKGNKKGQMLSQ